MADVEGGDRLEGALVWEMGNIYVGRILLALVVVGVVVYFVRKRRRKEIFEAKMKGTYVEPKKPDVWAIMGVIGAVVAPVAFFWAPMGIILSSLECSGKTDCEAFVEAGGIPMLVLLAALGVLGVVFCSIALRKKARFAPMHITGIVGSVIVLMFLIMGFMFFGI